MFKKAFTLAEILIVMAIIGTISAFTIPNLLSNHQDEQKVAKLRKVYNEFDLAYQELMLEHGNMALWGCSQATFKNYFLKKLKGTSITLSALPSSNNLELNDGVVVGVSDNTNYLDIFVLPEGRYSGNVQGRDLFYFTANYDGSGVFPGGFNSDRGGYGAFTVNANSYNTTNWVIKIGNFDYLKCNGLNWQNKTSCY